MGLRAAFVACVLPLVASCSPSDDMQRAPDEQAAQTAILIAKPTLAEAAKIPVGLLPAYETAAEAMAADKADAADDYRAQNPQWFAQTQPPPTGMYRPYGEWEQMQAVWTTYSNSIPNNAAVRRMFAEQTIGFVRNSKPKVKAYVIVNSQNVANDFNKALDSYGIKGSEKSQVQTVILPNQTIWLMDYSGFPLVHKQTGQVAFADWIYYQNRQFDDALGTRVGTEFYKGTVFRTPFPFEGGNIQADGTGQCATTTRALKNTGFSSAKVRNILKKWGACEKTYILKDITDDGTGHLDMFFKWLAPDHVMIGRYEDSLTLDYNGDGKQQTLPMPGKVAPDYAQTWQLNKQRMEDNVSLFQSSKTSQGKSFTISRLTMMTRYKDQYGNLPRTFINSTFTNGANVYPSYTTKSCRAPSGKLCNQDSQCSNGSHCAAGRCTPGVTTRGCDELVKCPSSTQCVTDPFKVALTARAQKQWQSALPTYTHIGLRADTIAQWSGAIHCITRTVPVGPVTKTVADGYCVKGTCGCVNGGANFACTDNKQCVGPARVCDCALCKGTCKGSTKSCTDDADCGQPIVDGSCVVDSAQLCPGQSSKPSSGNDVCKGISYEGQCSGKTLNYCDQTLKSQTCNNCCGWNKANGFYDCLNANSCQGCVNECDSTGQTGCSSQSTHAWTCTKVGGCFVRKWTKCSASCSNGTCSGGSANQVDVCPSSSKPDTQDSGAVTTDTASTDTNKADTSKPDTTGGTQDSGATPQDSAGQDGQSGCRAECAGKSCGPDGCGGICGVCVGTTTCVSGQCVSKETDAGASNDACTPQCGQCGPDGCGGSCGSCDVGAMCQQGSCVDEQAKSDANAAGPNADGIAASDAAGSDQAQMKVVGTSSGCSADPGHKPLVPWFWSLALSVGLIWWRKKRSAA